MMSNMQTRALKRKNIFRTYSAAGSSIPEPEK